MSAPRAAPARPFFLARGTRELFCLHHAPPEGAAVRGALVQLPAFAEEMNKSRRMVALQSRALAAAGWHVLQLDLTGTGDSSGDFADARWALWLDDVAAARDWLQQASGHAPGLWGLRLGALLAVQSASAQPAPALVLWQPVLSGRQHLQQFLRFKAGADWLDGGAAGAAKPMEQLQAGTAVEVAGYRVDPAFAAGMAAAAADTLPAAALLAWLEVSPRAGAALSPVAARLLAPLQGRAGVSAAVVEGPSFWQALEIETAPALIGATLEALQAVQVPAVHEVNGA